MGEALYCSLAHRFSFVWDDPAVGVLGCRLIDEFAERVAGAATGFRPAVTYSVSTEQRSKGPWYTLRAGDEIVAGTPDPERVAEQLLWRVSADALAGCEEYLLVHAGAISTPDAQGILVLGDSGAGKTTLVAALVQEGYGYLSDEAGVIDLGDGTMHPWPRPLGFEPATQQMVRFAGHGSRHVLAESLRPGAIGTRCRIRHVIDYSYLADAETSVCPLSGGEAVVAIGRSSPGLRHHGQRGLDLIVRVVKGAGRHRMVSGNLDEAVRAFAKLVKP